MSFKNYKGFPSIKIVALVDSFYRFRWISDIYAGSSGDATIWNESLLLRSMARGTWPPKFTTVTYDTIDDFRVCITFVFHLIFCIRALSCAILYL